MLRPRAGEQYHQDRAALGPQEFYPSADRRGDRRGRRQRARVMRRLPRPCPAA